MGAVHFSPHRDMTDEETDLFIAQCRAESRADAGLPPEEGGLDPAAATDTDADVPPFEPAPVRPTATGWTAFRQRRFIETLAASGCVSEAARAVGVTPRSAYRLRQRAGAESFDRAWDQALVIACNRLTALAFERAIHGTVRRVWHKGQIVAEERVPSERLLIYLLRHFDRTRYGNLAGFTPVEVADPRETAREALPAMLDALEDTWGEAERPSGRVTLAGDPPDPRDAV